MAPANTVQQPMTEMQADAAHCPANHQFTNQAISVRVCTVYTAQSTAIGASEEAGAAGANAANSGASSASSRRCGARGQSRRGVSFCQRR